MYQIDFKHPVSVYFIGIGGISMSGLAELLLDAGFSVSGSDWKSSPITQALEQKGIRIFYGEDASHITEDIDCAVLTSAVHEDNLEFAALRQRGIPCLSRAQLLGQIMKNYRLPIAVSGTHGKTTTTSMLSEILLKADTDPTLSIGGILKSIGGNVRVGKSDYFLTEACEYTNSFLSFFPRIALILNVEEDHLDFFKDLEDVERSFRRFADRVPEGGLIVANCEDANTRHVLEGETRPVLTFGVEQGDVHADNLTMEHGFGSFDVIYHGEKYAHLDLSVPGLHNVKNAIAAAAAAIALHLPGKAVEDGMRDFRLPGRRFEYKGMYNGAELCDDYAHHPGELASLFDTAAALGYQRVVCAFQPHTYSRTHELFDDFVKVLQRPDVTLLAEIFAAREDNDIGISSADLAAKIPGSIYCPTLADVTAKLREIARPGDLLLTVGAGDIYLAGEALIKEG